MIIVIGIPCSEWLIGLTIGILLSLPPAIITKVFAPILGIGAVASGLLVGSLPEGSTMVSGSFIVSALAAAFLGPASGAIAATLSEAASCIRLGTTARKALTLNLPGAVVAAVFEGRVIRALFDHPVNSPGFYVAVTLVTVVTAAAAWNGRTSTSAG